MLIVNPLYDVAFKYLMEDSSIARDLISRIIGEEIIEITLKPQEYSYKLRTHALTVFRLDFKAVIKLKEGQSKTVLIELQKAGDPADILRFRKYLGQHYQKQADIVSEPLAFPIVTIYFLGFNLPNIETSMVHVNRIYTDMVTNQAMSVTTDFIEQLTHDSFVILIPQLPPKERNEIERVLKIFNQAYQVGDDIKLMQITDSELESDELLKRMVYRLHDAASDNDFLEEMRLEETIVKKLDEQVRAIETLQFEIESKEQEIVGKEQELQSKKEEIQSKEEEIQSKEEEIQSKEEEIQSKEEEIQSKSSIIDEQAKLIEALKQQLKEKG